MAKQKRLDIAVVFGGQSAEHEISLASAAFVAQTLARRHRVWPLGIDRRGNWRLGRAGERDLATVLRRGRPVTLKPGGGRAALVVAGGRAPKIDLFFPVLHGPLGEDGTIQGLLELLDVPYAGCGVLASAAGMDKEVSRVLFAAHGLPVVKSVAVTAAGPRSLARLAGRCRSELGLPVFVKPARLGSSVGISRAATPAALTRALKTAFRHDAKAIVEQAVPRAREIECAVLGAEDQPPRVSVLGEIEPSREFYDYRAKYEDGGASRLLIPAPLPAALARRLREAAALAFTALGASGLARADFLLAGGSRRFYLNEVNTLPGFTPISMYPKLWAASGLDAEKLLAELVRLGLDRRRRLVKRK